MENQQNQLAHFSPEVWTRIFQYLSNEEDRLHCRFVSDYLANILDAMKPPSPSWTPWFSHHRTSTGEATMTFQKTPGSTFVCVEDIELLKKEIRKRPMEARKKNPFKNWTLIVNLRSEKEFELLLNELPKFLKEYGHHITKLLYTFHYRVPKSLEYLSMVLKHMTDLKSITFYSSTWLKVGADSLKLDFASFPALPQFTELKILGEYNFPFLDKFLDRYGPQIESLYWGHHEVNYAIAREEVFHRLFEKSPNLINFSFGKLPTIPYNFSGLGKVLLKGFALRIMVSDSSLLDSADYLITFRRIIKLINCFSDTVERLCLHVDKPRMDDTVEAGLNVANFPVLTELSLCFTLLDNPNLTFLLRKCPDLKTIILLDTENMFVSGENEKIRKKAENLWNQVAKMKVDKILVRYFRYNRELKKHFPILVEVEKPTVAN